MNQQEKRTIEDSPRSDPHIEAPAVEQPLAVSASGKPQRVEQEPANRPSKWLIFVSFFKWIAEQLNKWPIVVRSFSVAIFVATIDAVIHHMPDGTAKTLLDAAVKALLIGIFVLLWNQVSSLVAEVRSTSSVVTDLRGELDSTKGQMITEIDSVKDQIFEDARIIFARPSHSRTRNITILGVEEAGPVPSNLPSPRWGEGKWVQSISLLRGDRIQDFLFSREYLQYFFSLKENTLRQSRILIVNDVLRSKEAIYAYLELSKAENISTYVYKKSEFYDMLSCIPDLIANSEDAINVRRFLSGNPELSLMVGGEADFKDWRTGTPGDPNADYLLRYLAGFILEDKPTDSDVSHASIVWTWRLMAAACRNRREGQEAFRRIVDPPLPKNFWSCDELKRKWRTG